MKFDREPCIGPTIATMEHGVHVSVPVSRFDRVRHSAVKVPTSVNHIAAKVAMVLPVPFID